MGGVVCLEVSAGFFSDCDCRAVVLQQQLRPRGQCMRIVVGHRDARVLQWKSGGSPFHRDHREPPGECIEHLDREPACGSPWNPGEVACGVRELTGLLPVDAADVDGIGDACALGVLASRRGVRFGGYEQTCRRVVAPHEAQGFDETLPTLVPIEVASVEANMGVVGEAERVPCFTPRRARRGRRRPRDR